MLSDFEFQNSVPPLLAKGRHQTGKAPSDINRNIQKNMYYIKKKQLLHDCKITKNHKISRYQRIEFVSDFLEFLDFFSPRRLTTRSQILREQSHQSTRKESIISRRPMVQVRIGKVDRYHVQLSGLSSQGQRKCEKCEGCGTERLERMMVQRKMME